MLDKSMMDSGGGVAESGASAPFMSTPAGAAALIGSQFLMNYMAQRAADERAKREREMQIAQQHGSQEQQGLENLINVYRSALR
jgi:hypothetical protein